MRFGYQIGDGKNLVEHFGHRLRYEMLEHQKEKPLLGSEQGLRTPEVSHLTVIALSLDLFHQAAGLKILARMGKNGAFCESKRSGIPASGGKFRQGQS